MQPIRQRSGPCRTRPCVWAQNGSDCLQCCVERRGRLSWCVAALIVLSLALLSVRASEYSLAYVFSQEDGKLQLSVPRNAAVYYILQRAEDLEVFSAVALALGQDGATWAYAIPPDSGSAFFRLKVVDAFAPIDSDGDGIDDVYELQHPGILDPLNPTDAGASAPGQDGYSNYQVYLRDRFAGTNIPIQFFGHEATVFNFGAPTASRESISAEISVYNALPGSGPPPTNFDQVFSRETTIWNYGSPSARVEAVSSEATVYNLGSPSATIEAISREFSVYSANPGSGAPTTDLGQVFGREITLYNYGAVSARLEAVSREITVLNYQDPGQ